MQVQDLFAAAVANHGHRIAIDVPPASGRPERQTATYAELAHMAAAVADALRPFVSGECIVAVLLARNSPRLHAAQIGILAAGAAHLCLDPTFPDAHIEHVLRDCGAVAIVTDEPGAARIRSAGVRVLDIAGVLARPGAPIALPPAPPWATEHLLAYVIYTSGTTGKSKGVLLEHAGAVSLIRSGVERFGIGPGDRIAQGSSPAYDSSIEESWLALASGATLVVLDDETVRLGPDLVPWLRKERITILCPPPTLLRAIDCRDPAKELPDLRLCYVGGEAMSTDLVEVWGKDLWLENGYGPTECTVTAVRGRLHPGELVTIGTAIPGMAAHVLDERLVAVPDGSTGELCLSGLGLARGYLGLPELSAERFVRHASLGRLYRTGDLAVRRADGVLVCLGRIDSQVKIRGYRIELEAIEAELARCPGVREAACRVQGEGDGRHIVAFVVPQDERSVPNARDLEVRLRAVLPGYMVPARFATLAVLPKSIGGKLDRKALVDLGPTAAATEPAPLPLPERPDEYIDKHLDEYIAATITAVLGLGSPVALDADFFALGGDSLRAALLVSRLRRDQRTQALTVRDVYQARSAAALAICSSAKRKLEPARRIASAEGAGRPLLATCVQASWLLLTLLLGSVLAYAAVFELLPRVFAALGVVAFLVLSPLLWAVLLLVYAGVTLWLLVLVKELLIGRYTPMRAPAWSSFHVRHWIVVHTARLVPWAAFTGTGFVCFALRALGARVGRRVHVDRGVDLMRGGWDLLEIGDDVTLCREASLGLVELDAGHLVVGAVRIANGATLETRAGVGAGAEVAEGTVVTALSYLSDGARTGPGELWDGVPARCTGRARAAPEVDVSSRELHPILHGVAVLGIRALLLPSALVPLVLLLAYLLGRAGFSEAALLDWLWGTGPSAHPAWILYAVCAPVVALPFWLLAQALLVRVTGAAPLGTMSRWSVAYLRIWLRIGTVEAAGIWLSGTLFWPLWLRLAGMRIGKKCEISTILDVLPEHTEIGAESFLADGIYLGVPWIQRGTVTVGRTVLGAGTFLGNHVVIRSGERMARGMLLGICTVFDQARMGEGTAWFGHPAFLLPRREVVTLDRSLTHDPSPIRFGNRLFWESLRVLLPALPVWLALLWFDVVDRAEATHGLAMLALAVPLATLGVGIALTGVVLVLKWLLLGRVRPGQHALWSCWASRWDFHYVVWNLYGRGLLAALEGTLFLPWFLRAMGMRIGRGVVLGEGFAQVVDPDMLTLEDGATVHALFQAHSFEDRVLKIDRVRVGKGATVGRGTVLLYGADIGEQAHVAPHGVVMKREVLQPFRSYSGAPTAEVERAFETGAEPVREAIPTPAPAPRDEALDFARGLAVLGMVFLHFVPDTAGETGLGALCTGIVTALHGKPAALFAMLAGMSFVLQAGRRTDARRRRLWFARRALALGVAGLLLWIFVWPTEVLLPLALMMPLVVAIARGGPLRTLATILALLIAVPFATAAFWHYVEVDCLEDGTHLANSTFGWSTLRYFLFDGSYPILPWLVLLLLGALLVAGGHRQPNRSGRWFWVALPFALVMQTFVLWAEAAREELGALWPYLGPTWQPTSLVWLASIGSWAIVVIAGACWWQARRGLPAFVSRVTSVGRASLSHYLLHILLVFVPLRWWWPAEDWGVGVGLGAAAGYAVLALVVTPWWFSRFARGPFESALARASGS